MQELWIDRKVFALILGLAIPFSNKLGLSFVSTTVLTPVHGGCHAGSKLQTCCDFVVQWKSMTSGLTTSGRTNINDSIDPLSSTVTLTPQVRWHGLAQTLTPQIIAWLSLIGSFMILSSRSVLDHTNLTTCRRNPEIGAAFPITVPTLAEAELEGVGAYNARLSRGKGRRCSLATHSYWGYLGGPQRRQTGSMGQSNSLWLSIPPPK